MRELGAAALALALGFSPGAAQVTVVHSTPSGAVHEMVLVPEGEFTMGTDEVPGGVPRPHAVYLDAFHMDRYEVTVAQFLDFLNAHGSLVGADGHEWISLDQMRIGVGAVPTYRTAGSGYEPTYPDSTDHPVTCVTWYGANAYCSWAGLRLPTEAEWEKAARGTDRRNYPWGEGLDRGKTNAGATPVAGPDSTDGFWTTAPVGSFPEDRSPYGVYDMGGNVNEWVWSWYAAEYYTHAPYRNPRGPEEGTAKVIRGGSWFDSPGTPLTTWYSGLSAPRAVAAYCGFRCARDAAGGTTSAPRSTWGGVKDVVR